MSDGLVTADANSMAMEVLSVGLIAIDRLLNDSERARTWPAQQARDRQRGQGEMGAANPASRPPCASDVVRHSSHSESRLGQTRHESPIEPSRPGDEHRGRYLRHSTRRAVGALDRSARSRYFRVVPQTLLKRLYNGT